MQAETTPTDVRLALYVRSLQPRQASTRQAAVVETIDTLASSGRIDDYTVTIWGRQLPARREAVQTEVGEKLLEQVTLFGEWARRNGYDFERTFPVRTVDSKMCEDHYEARTVPQLTMAEYHDDSLVFVAPVAETTIEQRLAALQAGDLLLSSTEPVERAVSVEETRTVAP